MLILLAYFGHSALCYSQDYWLPLFRNIVSVDTSFILKASLHYTKCNTSTTMHNFILINYCENYCADCGHYLSSRLHLSSCSVIGSLEDRNVLMTIQDNYFNTVCYFEQVLLSKFHGNLSFSSSRLHPSSCSVIGSVEDRSVLMTIHDIYFNTVFYFEKVLSSKFSESLSFSSSRLPCPLAL